MSVLISGVLVTPAGEPVSNAEITFTAIANSAAVLNGFSASITTNSQGEYCIDLALGEYALTLQANGQNSVYGTVSVNDQTTPSTLNALLRQQMIEQSVTPSSIVYFREILADVTSRQTVIKQSEAIAAVAAKEANDARLAAAEYARILSEAVESANASANNAQTFANQSGQFSAAAEDARQKAEQAANSLSQSATQLINHLTAPDPHPQYAPLENPALTGTPTAPTAANNDNSKTLATTAFVTNALVGKLTKDQNGADIPDKAAFLQHLGLGDGTGRLVNVQIFTSSGVYTPTTSTTFIIVAGVGGGAGGGGSSSPSENLYSAAGGGVSGTYGKAKFPVPLAPVAVTIGAKGSGGVAGTTASGTVGEGTAGGDTALGTLLRCPGGKMSKGAYSFPVNSVCSSEFSAADAPVVDASGVLIETVHGEASTPGIIMGTFLISGRGGDSPLGRGGIPRYRRGDDLSSGADGSGYGAGGGGACSGTGLAGMPGGSGTQGCLIIWEYA